jgi:hypothetical protein
MEVPKATGPDPESKSGALTITRLVLAMERALRCMRFRVRRKDQRNGPSRDGRGAVYELTISGYEGIKGVEIAPWLMARRQ